MEPDSTTYDNITKSKAEDPSLPFNTCPSNIELYKELIADNAAQRLECQLVEKLQALGLLPTRMKCPTNTQNCNMICRTARVIDRMQWVCAGCGKKQPIRAGSFFFKLQCTILQALQIILAWCEDAELEVAAEHFGVKTKIATLIYDRLDELAIKEQQKQKLGGANSVVLMEMYPDCVNRLSPDTTDQSHTHRILMLADTNHIPTSYWLHVIKEDNKKANDSDNQTLVTEIKEVLSRVVIPNSIVMTGNNVPHIDNTNSIQQLLQHYDADMQHFLSTRIWRQALTLCSAAGGACVVGGAAGAGDAAGAGGAAGSGAGGAAGAGSSGAARACGAGGAQRYLSAALYRLRHAHGFYRHVLQLVAHHFTDCYL